MHEITKTFTWSASHMLKRLPSEHQCSHLHGHNYSATFHFKGDINSHGFVIDFNELRHIKEWIDNRLDHAHIAEDEDEAAMVIIMMKKMRGEEFEQKVHVLDAPSSSEVIARYLFQKFNNWYPSLVAVSVSETPKTGATYRP